MTWLITAATAVALAIAAVEPVAGAERILLQTSTAFFVGPKGSDKNDCRSVRTACATLQRAVTNLYQNYDLGCRSVTINVMIGSTIPGAEIDGVLPGQCRLEDLTIIGDTTRTVASRDNLYPYGRTITSSIIVRGGARLRVEGLRLRTEAGPALSTDDGLSRLEAGFVDFGPVGTYHMVAGVHARLKMTNNYTISGGGQGHANIPRGQWQMMPGVAATFITSESDRVKWSTAFIVGVEYGMVNISWGNPDSVPDNRRSRFLNEFNQECSEQVVCAQGQRWGIALLSLIYTGGGHADPHWLPGDQAPALQGINSSRDSIYN